MSIEEQIVKRLTEKKMTLTTAESCTGGLIAKKITDVSGSSYVFECGIVSYSNRIKHELLSVKNETLEKFGAVSEETAREMVAGVLELSGADIAVAVTGIAGPNSDDTEKPVGLVYIAVGDSFSTEVKEYRNQFTENVRENNRNKTAQDALNLIWEKLSYE